jgi:hypothetical protein
MYVLDTNIFNWLVDGKIQLNDLPSDGEFAATHVQRDELAKTKDHGRRAQLMAKFGTTINREVPTESLVVGVSRVGLAKVSDGKLYHSLRDALNDRNEGKKNNAQDALIAEVAIKKSWILVTADKALAEVAKQHGCKVRHYTP